MACGEDHRGGKFPKVTAFEQSMIDLKSGSQYDPPIIDDSLYPKSRVEIKPINVISKFTVQELVDELSQRDGVFTKHIEPLCDYIVYGKATVLIVGKQP